MNLLQLIVPKSKCQYLLTSTTLRQALEKFKYHRYATVPILDSEGRFFGTLSEGDLLELITNKDIFNIKEYENITIKDINLHRSYKILNINCTFDELVNLSLDQSFVPIEDDRGFFIGIIKRKEIIENLSNKYIFRGNAV